MRWLAGLVILVAACSGGAEPQDLHPELAQLPGLITYRDHSGNVAVTSPPGGSTHNLTEDASPNVAYQQPTWSPEGLLAWTAIEEQRPAVWVADVDSGDVTETPLPMAPFYYFWGPDGTTLAALGSVGGTLELWLIDTEAGTSAAAARGSPFYFSWAPDGSRMVTHVGNETLSIVGRDGESVVLSEESSGYQAPAWSSRDQLAHVATGPETLAGRADVAQAAPRSRLVIMDASGGQVRVLQTFQGVASFSFESGGRRLAYSITPVQERALTGVNFGPLAVADLDRPEVTTVSTDPVVLYQWSPSGDALLFAAVVAEGSSRELRWRVFSESGVRDYGSFLPTSEFSQAYLPFWDQFAQSVRLWSPDGMAFTYTARDGSGDFVLVQLLSEAFPRRLTEGSIAFWSP